MSNRVQMSEVGYQMSEVRCQRPEDARLAIGRDFHYPIVIRDNNMLNYDCG